MVTKLSIKEKTNINLYKLGDIHAGSVTCQKRELKHTINKIKRDPNARVILMGDYAEYIFEDDTRRYDKLCVDKKLNTVEKQTNYIVNMFSPIAKKIYGVLLGNHESAYAKYHKEEYEGEKYSNEAEYIAQALNTKYLGELAIIELRVCKQPYNIVVTHGCGASTKLSGQITALNRLIECFESVPDVVAMGHVHALQTIVNPKLSYKFKTKIKHLALTGSYYKTYIEGNVNYASSNLYGPLPIGCVMYQYDKEGNIKDNKIIY